MFDLNRKILVLRYGTNILQNCIEEHIKVCEDNGFCWFGKIGRAPSVKAINDVLENEKGAVILYSKDECYLCKAEGISYDQPKCGYPSYYDDYIYNKGLSPSMYVKLTSIEKISTNDLEKLVVSSSKNKLITTLNKSMNSFFVAEVVGADSNRKNVAKVNEKKQKEILSINDCVYRKDGRCNCRGFVNYQYECVRPSTCVKQKR